MYKCLRTVAETLLTREEHFNQLDSEVGDGDTGSGLARACREILLYIDHLDFSLALRRSTVQLGYLIANSFAGSSGPLYGTFFTHAAQHLK